MKKRKSVRAIVFKDNKLFLIHRKKNNEEYYVFPGGGIEEGENEEQALERELLEEIGVKANKIKMLYTIEDEKTIQYFYLCEYVSGDFSLAIGPEWTSEEYKSHGEYIQELVNMNEVENYNIVPTKVAKVFFENLKEDKTLKSIELKNIK